jgi:hypothetical protein
MIVHQNKIKEHKISVITTVTSTTAKMVYQKKIKNAKYLLLPLLLLLLIQLYINTNTKIPSIYTITTITSTTDSKLHQNKIKEH